MNLQYSCLKRLLDSVQHLGILMYNSLRIHANNRLLFKGRSNRHSNYQNCRERDDTVLNHERKSLKIFY